jgi:hypothetical protein
MHTKRPSREELGPSGFLPAGCGLICKMEEFTGRERHPSESLKRCIVGSAARIQPGPPNQGVQRHSSLPQDAHPGQQGPTATPCRQAAMTKERRADASIAMPEQQMGLRERPFVPS